MRYFLFVITLVLFSCGNDKKGEKILEEGSTTTYYLIRHAEKDRSGTENPGLIAKGKDRAIYWATYFKNIPLDAVYSTDYNRTKQTAAPTATNKSLPVELYDTDNLYNAQFQEATKGKKVLVVGHSNTTPALVNIILGKNKYQSINDAENAILYKVVVSEKKETTVQIDTIKME